MDQNTLPEDGGEFVSFCDLKVPMPSTVGILAEKTGVPVVLLESISDKRGHYFMDVCASHFLDGLQREDITSRIALEIEKQIKSKPEYWLWSYKRWKYRLEGEPADSYPFYSKLYTPGQPENEDLSS
jgi:KDO2-lipid IV(A) lauroyltransferase